MALNPAGNDGFIFVNTPQVFNQMLTYLKSLTYVELQSYLDAILQKTWGAWVIYSVGQYSDKIDVAAWARNQPADVLIDIILNIMIRVA